MKKFLLSLIVSALIVPTAQGALTYLPESDIEEYNGYKIDYVNNTVLEFAVYDTVIQDDMSGLGDLEGYGGERFIYAYQVFNYGVEAIEGVKISSEDGATLTSDDLGATNFLDNQISYGVETNDWFVNQKEAIWLFEEGTLIGNQRSWFLMIFSNNAPTRGIYEVNPAGSDPWGPGAESAQNSNPEPATLLLLSVGAVWSLKRRQ